MDGRTFSKELSSEAEWREGWEAMRALRPTLTLTDFLSRREAMIADGYHFIGTYVDGEICSIASFLICPHPVHGRELFIHDMATKASLQNKGYGSLILEFIDQAAVAYGCGRIFVHTKKATKFYEKNGFASYSTGLIKMISN